MLVAAVPTGGTHDSLDEIRGASARRGAGQDTDGRRLRWDPIDDEIAARAQLARDKRATNGTQRRSSRTAKECR
jgi:hypothetical protein